LKASYAVSEVLWTLIQEKLYTQIIHIWNFRRPHPCHTQDEFAELLDDKNCSWNSQNRVYVIFR